MGESGVPKSRIGDANVENTLEKLHFNKWECCDKL